MAWERSLWSGADGPEWSSGEIRCFLGVGPRRRPARLAALEGSEPRLPGPVVQVKRYGERLIFQQGAGRGLTVPSIETLVTALRQKTGRPIVLFVDYIQKIPSEPERSLGSDPAARVVQSLKELALEQHLG